MTTWELASEAQRREITLLIERLQHAGIDPPSMPPSATTADLASLTKRDAGKLLTRLRETWNEHEESR
jgi:hypothetical protein